MTIWAITLIVYLLWDIFGTLRSQTSIKGSVNLLTCPLYVILGVLSVMIHSPTSLNRLQDPFARLKRVIFYSKTQLSYMSSMSVVNRPVHQYLPSALGFDSMGILKQKWHATHQGCAYAGLLSNPSPHFRESLRHCNQKTSNWFFFTGLVSYSTVIDKLRS